jgi:molecular chaperone IbpA
MCLFGNFLAWGVRPLELDNAPSQIELSAGRTGRAIRRGALCSAPHVASRGGYVMRHFDLSPLYRQTVGFDRLFNLLDQAGGVDSAYPPYNIERTGENAYRVTLAVAGFSHEELTIETKENTLSIKGSREQTAPAQGREMLHQGIAARAFERRFQLADHVIVTGASLVNGLLHVDLVRELPEAQKPRRIEIRGGAPVAKVVESKAA